MIFPERKDLQGTGNHCSKLTEAQVEEIRNLYATGNPKLRIVAEKYSVTPVTIWRIKHRENWRHV